LDRFQREAKTLAALDHPNIVTIYPVESAAVGEGLEPSRAEVGPCLTDAVHFLTMQLVEGKQLSELIPKGGMPLDRIFDIAIPLANALAAAHEKGVIHRDLKPANVMLSDDGRLKVLDFGLAKLRPGIEAAMDTELPTEPLTGEGRILGTAPYMSPEQLEGRPVDHRSDIFSLGAVLYEIATGERPFKGDTSISLISSIVKKEPQPVDVVKEALPHHLARIIRHCLEKEPKRRYQSALDVRNELEDLRGETEGDELWKRTKPVPTFRFRKRWAIAGLLGIGLVAIGWWFLVVRVRWTPLPPPRYIPFTSDGGWKDAPRLSPDGERVAYAWRREPTEDLDIYVKALGLGAEPLRLTDNPGDETSPVWSPDGRQIAFVRLSKGGDAIHVVPSMGGRERRLSDLAGSPGYSSLSWSPDGGWIAFSERSSEEQPYRVAAISPHTGERKILTSPPPRIGGDLSPTFSPHGDLVAFVRRVSPDWGNNDVWVQPIDGGEARRLTFQESLLCTGLAWTADGKEVVYSMGPGRSGWGRTSRVSLGGGQPQPLEGLGSSSDSVSISGSRLVYRETSPAHQDIWRVQGRRSPDEARIPERIIASSSHDGQPVFSPDGTRIAFLSLRSGAPDIWLAQHDGAQPTQLTSVKTSSGTPARSPDGRRIVFDSLDSGSADLWVVEAEGGAPRQLTFSPADDTTPSWSRDGRWIYFHSDRSGTTQIWKIPAEGGEVVQVTQEGGFYARESWDGGTL
jgi:Tol biopolymer transport system component